MNLKRGINRGLAKFLVIAFLFCFPFGQLLRFDINFASRTIPIIAIDLIALLSIIYIPFISKPKISWHFNAFFAACVLSLLLSFSYLEPLKVIMGSLYFVRLFAYYSFLILTWNLVKKSPKFKTDLFYLITISFVLAAIFGWLQYFLFFDLTYLKYAGWDDHLGRLVGTFLDPGFTGLIFVIAFFFSFNKYLYQKKGIHLLFSLFFMATLLFTYSRASYLAFVVGMAITYLLKRKIKPVIIFLVIFFIAIPFLPRTRGEGVRLERTKSIGARYGNYQETISIIKKYPLFGVGYNNICPIRETEFKDDTKSHACTGSDSSLLYVLATTGVVGSILFLNLMKKTFFNLAGDYYGDLLKVSSAALFVHSIFSNSFFYPWILGFFAILLGIAVKENKLRQM